MTSFTWFSSTLIVRHLMWLMNCRRNRISFVFFVLFAWLILRVLLAWFWLKLRICGSPFPSTFHFGLSYHCLVSSVLVTAHLGLLVYFFVLLFIIVYCVLQTRNITSIQRNITSSSGGASHIFFVFTCDFLGYGLSLKVFYYLTKKSNPRREYRSPN